MTLGQLADPRIRLIGNFSVTRSPDGKNIEIFAKANNGYLYHTFTTAPDTWTPNGWQSLGGQSIPFANDPVASWGSDGNLNVFATVAQNNPPIYYVYHLWTEIDSSVGIVAHGIQLEGIVFYNV